MHFHRSLTSPQSASPRCELRTKANSQCEPCKSQKQVIKANLQQHEADTFIPKGGNGGVEGRGGTSNMEVQVGRRGHLAAAVWAHGMVMLSLKGIPLCAAAHCGLRSPPTCPLFAARAGFLQLSPAGIGRCRRLSILGSPWRPPRPSDISIFSQHHLSESPCGDPNPAALGTASLPPLKVLMVASVTPSSSILNSYRTSARC